MTTYRVITDTKGFLGKVESDHYTLEDALCEKKRMETVHYKVKPKIYTVEVVEKLKAVKI